MDQQLTEARIINARQSLTQRMAALERRVVSTTEETVDQVRETAESVHSAVTGTMDDVRGIWSQVSDGVRDSLDVVQYVRAHPCQVLTLATAAGFLAGYFARPSTVKRDGQFFGVVGDLMGVLRKELLNVGEATIAAGAAAIKQNLATATGPTHDRTHSYSNGRV